MLIGAQVPDEDPLGEAKAIGAEAIQMFLGNPQSFEKPKPRADAEALRAAEVPVYVHAPYRLNVCHPSPRIRVPSRKTLAQTVDAAAAIGAAGVIVHGGHAEDDPAEGPTRWWKVFEERTFGVVGTIDLVHCNNSRDAAGSGADRHANIAAGKMEPAVIRDMVAAAKAPVVIFETPWPGIADDLAW